MAGKALRQTAPAALSLALYIVLAAVLLVIVLVRTGYHFTYCLDDPYIHLALAERLRHGLYGLNAGEPTSPSSSILWPWLFVPFAGTAVMRWLPLAINVVCGAATAWLLGSFVAECFRHDSTRSRTLRTSALACLLVVGLNLLGLTYTGLEHSLQVLLCVACAFAATRAMHGERVPTWGLAAAILLPSIRYEGLLITFGLAVVLAGVRAWRTAVGILVASAVLPTGFSLLLHHLGLPWFPLSVLVKSSYKFADQSPLPVRIARLFLQTLKQSLFDLERLPQLLITVCLVVLAYRYRHTRSLRFALGGGAVVGAVQVFLGPVGWFYRYEVYALAFTLLLLIAATALPRTERMTESDLGTRSRGNLDVTSPHLRANTLRSAPPVSDVLLLATAALALIYLRPLLSIPRAALGIYEQQYQLGRLAGDFYHDPIAINDLGWVAFRRTSDQYVLDLYGLGSYETFRTPQKDRTPAWLDRITREHNVGLVAIYPEWFPQGIPATWTPVARLCATDVDTRLGPVSQRVMFYRTPSASSDLVGKALEHWQESLPDHVALQLNPQKNATFCSTE